MFGLIESIKSTVFEFLKPRTTKTIEDTQDETHKILKSKEYAQTKHIKSILRERQKQIDKTKTPEEIRESKEEFRMRMYKATQKKREKDHELERSR